MSSRNIWLPIIAVTGILCVCLGVYWVFFNSSQSNQSQQIPSASSSITPAFPGKNVVIPANVMWFDTGLDTTNRVVNIQYVSGVWSNTSGDGNIWNDAAGNQSWPGLVVPNSPLRSLVGKTNDGTFYVGKNYSGTPGRGRLYLGMNDVVGTYGDNMGQIEVAISVR